MSQNEQHHRIPESNESFWRAHKELPDYPAFSGNKSTEVAVVGAGIAGVITAYLLAKEGKKVTLLDAGKLIDGVTGYTTAKISAQHGLYYAPLIKLAGEKQAKLYYEANMAGLKFIEETARELNIDCDFSHRDAFIYSTKDATVKLLEQEAESYDTLGIAGGLAREESELPFPVTEALVMRNQAQFHPVKFLAGLVKEMENMGVDIHEQSRAMKILSKKDPVLQMENLSHLSCDRVVVATHYPFNDFDGMYFSRLSVNRSYAIAVRTEGKIPEGMYISADGPSRSIRFTPGEDGENLLLLGGDGHATGQSSVETMEHYKNLAKFGEDYFAAKDIPYRWSSQDMTTLDKIPYVGTITAGYENILVATGFHKWGMANGAIAGRILTDQIVGRDNPYAALFDPTRPKVKAADAASFLKDNASVAKELVSGKLKKASKTIDDLQKGQGSLVKVDGKKVGGYRDEYNQVHLVKPTCTHMGCDVAWNDAETSWDCPCHGSRFSHTGEVLEGPAVKPLKKIEGGI